MAGKRNNEEKSRPIDDVRGTRPRGQFEKGAAPEATNRDHPESAPGLLKSAPGAGIVSSDARVDSGEAGGGAEVGRKQVSPEEGQARRGTTTTATPHDAAHDAGAAVPLNPGVTAETGSAGAAAAETSDPNYSARRVARTAPGDAGFNRMDTSGRTAQTTATHRANPQLVRDVMTADVEVCNPDTELYYVARMMMERDCGAIPVVESTDSMRPVGIVTDRDIVVRSIAKNTNPLRQRARDCMSMELATVAADAPVEECILAMEERQLRRMLVLDNTGRLCGIVAQADLVRHEDAELSAELVREVSADADAAGQQAPPT